MPNDKKSELLHDCVKHLNVHMKAAAQNAARIKGTYESGLGEEMYALHLWWTKTHARQHAWTTLSACFLLSLRPGSMTPQIYAG
jgi:hypothetical protein